jgi:hypothetical protein
MTIAIIRIRSGAGLDLVKYSEEDVARRDHGETCGLKEIDRLSVPVTAELLCMPFRPTVLPSAKPLTVAPPVLQEKDPALRTANTSHLSKRSYRVWKRTNSQGGNHGIEAFGQKTQRLGVHRQKARL